MAKRRNPQNRILEYFDSASIEEATNTLAVCQWIVAKRTAPAAKPRAVRKPRQASETTTPQFAASNGL